jgi:uncharacterized protein
MIVRIGWRRLGWMRVYVGSIRALALETGRSQGGQQMAWRAGRRKLVRIVNGSKGTELGSQVAVARTLMTRGKGLMLRRQLESGAGLIIDPCSSIHTMWMRFPIDVLYVDADGRVVRFDATMRPWRFGPLFVRGRYVVELPVGTIQRSRTEVGDYLTFEPVAS